MDRLFRACFFPRPSAFAAGLRSLTPRLESNGFSQHAAADIVQNAHQFQILNSACRLQAVEEAAAVVARLQVWASWSEAHKAKTIEQSPLQTCSLVQASPGFGI